MGQYRDKALSFISDSMPEDIRKALEKYVDFVIERKK